MITSVKVQAGSSQIMSNSRYIAMWSGPRNISTAMMRSWGNRADTFVCDEPFYAHYLNETRLEHPGMDEVIASQPTDWREVVRWLTGPVPGNKAIFYQKQMSHHLLPAIGRDWLENVTNAFLIRDPQDMILSLSKVLSEVRLVDTGLPQQLEIFEQVRRKGYKPAVVDSRDVQNHPETVLPKLCEVLEVDFDPAMLSWPVGRRETDGIWAKYWYANVEKTTCFEPYKSKSEPTPEALRPILSECIEIYNRLAEFRITPSS
jgi:hypothetical protein